jgi:hypothetical protein
VFTQTLPLPPPGAGVNAVAGEGLGVGFDLNKLLNGLDEVADGDGEGVAPVVALDFVFRFGAGVTEGDGPGLVLVFAAGDAVVVGAGDGEVFLVDRFGAGDAAGDVFADAAGEGEALASAFLRECLGEGETLALGVGDCAWTNAAPVRAITRVTINRFIGEWRNGLFLEDLLNVADFALYFAPGLFHGAAVLHVAVPSGFAS